MAADDPRPELRTAEFTPAPRSLLDLELAQATEAAEAAELRVVLGKLHWSQRNLEAIVARGVKRAGELEFIIDQGRQMIEWCEAELARYEADEP